MGASRRKWIRREGGWSPIVDVVRLAVGLDEAEARIEAIGRALNQHAEPDSRADGFGFGHQKAHHPGTQSLALKQRGDVEMLKSEVAVRAWTKSDAPRQRAFYDDQARVVRPEGIDQTLAGAGKIKATDAFQTFPHGGDPEGDERLKIIGSGRREAKRFAIHQQVEPPSTTMVWPVVQAPAREAR